MKHSLVATALAVLVSLCAATGPAAAADVTVGPLVVSDSWARASAAPTMKNGAAFFTVANSGSTMDRLVAAATPVAAKAELHTHLMEGGVMKMRPVEAIEVHPGAPVVLQPGGLHVMLMGLKAPLAEGTRIPLTLVFEKAGRVDLSVPVLGAGARGPAGDDAPHHSGMEMKPGS